LKRSGPHYILNVFQFKNDRVLGYDESRMWNECLAPKLVDESDEFDELEVVEKIIVLLIPNTNMIGVYFIPTRIIC
jgi:hypothetical protein